MERNSNSLMRSFGTVRQEWFRRSCLQLPLVADARLSAQDTLSHSLVRRWSNEQQGCESVLASRSRLGCEIGLTWERRRLAGAPMSSGPKGIGLEFRLQAARTAPTG